MYKKAKKIEFIVLDVDGTLTDGSIYIDNNGLETKAFNVKDGFAIAQSIKMGIPVAIITGRSSKIVEKRASELGIVDIYQGVANKVEVLSSLLNKYGFSYEQCAYMGDDINDIPVMVKSGFVGVPADAVDEVRALAHFVSKKEGGKGAVREFVDYILKERKIYNKIVDNYKKLSDLED